jgi:pyrroloquinoline-quinone synthase
VNDERGLQFFTVHIGADEWHAEVGRGFIDRYGDEDPEAVRKTAERCLDALWGFLDGVQSTRVAAGVAV